MKLYEHEAKEVFDKMGIPIPQGKVTENSNKAKEIYGELDKAVMKAQVLTGGRGKAGGIKFPETEAEVEKYFTELMDMEINGFSVDKLLVEEAINIEQELYVGFTIDRSSGKIVAIASSRGGVNIEEVAQEHPEAIVREYIDIRQGLPTYKARDILRRIDLRGKTLLKGANLFSKLYDVFVEYNAKTAEINPLVVTDSGNLIAADAKLEVDNEALDDFPELKREDEFLTDLEREARRHDLGYVEMEGDIGVIGNGAGLNITTLDILRHYGVKPANFLEVSGRTYMLAEKAIEIVLKKPNVRAIFGNFFGSMSRCDVIAEGLADAIEKGIVDKPMVVAMRGNGAKEGRKTLKEAGIEVYKDDRKAGRRLIEILDEGGD